MPSPPAYLQPEVLRWARESFGLSIDEAANRIKTTPARLEGAERGRATLTMRQAEAAAHAYDRPLALLFAPEPPAEEPQEAQFRRLPGAPAPPWPSEMIGLARRVSRRQQAALELLDLLDEYPVWPGVHAALTAVRTATIAKAVRAQLGISLAEQFSWQDRDGYVPLRHWIDAVEELGILVVQDGSLPVELMRGFASLHEQMPVIVLNTQDDPRARVFTLMHELGHLLRGDQPPTAQLERWLEKFAGDVLLPRMALAQAVEDFRTTSGLRQFDLIALQFGVTPRAAVVRSVRASLISQDEANEILDQISGRGPRERGGGGNYYRTQLARLSPSYTRLVFSALENQAVTYPAASTLLDGVKVNNFGQLRHHLDRRAEMT